MIYTGLVSITFRKLIAQDIIKLVSKAGLDGIEWGGDIHVPHGNIKIAKEVYKMTIDAGLDIAAYGSYYKVGCEKENDITFEQVLETATILHAPTIRVWAGNRSSNDIDEDFRQKVINESKHIAELSQKAGITISIEYHPNTLTDTLDSAYKLFTDLDHPNIYSYWQAPLYLDHKERLIGLKRMKPWLSNIHVYHWISMNRAPLLDGEKEWSEYINEIKGTGKDHYMMIEFVKNDAPEQFLLDAKALKNML